MKRYYKCRKDTGEILATISVSNMNVIEDLTSDEKLVTYIEDVVINPKTMYNDPKTDKLIARPTISYQDVVSVNVNESITIDDIPEFTKVFLDGNQVGTAIDGTLELIIPVSGTYTLKLVPDFPYVEKEISVEVT
jgi:hypothetical protein